MPLIFMIQLPKHSSKRGRIIAHAHHFGNSRVQPFPHVGQFTTGEVQCRYDPDRSQIESGYVVAFRNA